jgi:hypothetical protein
MLVDALEAASTTQDVNQISSRPLTLRDILPPIDIANIDLVGVQQHLKTSKEILKNMNQINLEQNIAIISDDLNKNSPSKTDIQQAFETKDTYNSDPNMMVNSVINTTKSNHGGTHYGVKFNDEVDFAQANKSNRDRFKRQKSLKNSSYFFSDSFETKSSQRHHKKKQSIDYYYDNHNTRNDNKDPCNRSEDSIQALIDASDQPVEVGPKEGNDISNQYSDQTTQKSSEFSLSKLLRPDLKPILIELNEHNITSGYQSSDWDDDWKCSSSRDFFRRAATSNRSNCAMSTGYSSTNDSRLGDVDDDDNDDDDDVDYTDGISLGLSGFSSLASTPFSTRTSKSQSKSVCSSENNSLACVEYFIRKARKRKNPTNALDVISDAIEYSTSLDQKISMDENTSSKT